MMIAEDINFYKQNSKRFPCLDLIHFIGSLLIILIHNGRLTDSALLQYILTTLGRLAVPTFLISSTYFFRIKNRTTADYSKRYFKKNLKEYLFWSLFYLPYGFFYLTQTNTPLSLYPVALVLAFLFLGTCYHLWYYPALFFSLWLIKSMTVKSPQVLLWLTVFLLFSFGACETYAGYLSGSFIGTIYDHYHQLFITTRIGLFFSPIFILFGFFLADSKNDKFIYNKLPFKLFLCSILLIIESYFIYLQPGNDRNFLFSTLPLSFFLVAFCLQTNWFKTADFTYLKKLSKYFFLLHPIFLESLKLGHYRRISLFLLTLLLTFFTAILVVYGSETHVAKKRTLTNNNRILE